MTAVRLWRAVALTAAMMALVAQAGCDDPEADTTKPTGFAKWNGPNFDTLKPLPAETALLIASHRQKGSESKYDVMIEGTVEASDGRKIEEARATQVTEKVLYQGRNLPNSTVVSPYSLDLTEIREDDLKRWVKTVMPNGNVNIDTANTMGAIDFGGNGVDVMGFKALPMDTRRCPIALCPDGPGTEPQPFNIRGGLQHYLLAHFPPADGPGGGTFRAGGTWKTRVPVFYPLTGLDASMYQNCRFLVYTDSRLEGFRQGADVILARISYSYEGHFDSREPEMAKRFAPDWGTHHLIIDKLTGTGKMVVDVGRGEVIWREEESKFEITEQHLMPPDPKRPDPTVDMDGKWETSSKTITEKFHLQKVFPRTPEPPERPPLP